MKYKARVGVMLGDCTLYITQQGLSFNGMIKFMRAADSIALQLSVPI
jgi:hypothetical protein